MAKRNLKLTPKQQSELNAAHAAVPTATATKSVRATARQAAKQQQSDDERIALLVSKALQLELDRRDKLANRIPGIPTPAVNRPIPALLQALVNDGTITQEIAQAKANNLPVSPDQSAGADNIPAQSSYERPVAQHYPACIKYAKDKDGHEYHFFSVPNLGKAPTGWDKQDRTTMGYGGAIGILDEETQRVARTYAELCESEQADKVRKQALGSKRGSR